MNLPNIGSGMTPLHAAAFQGHGKIAHLLLESGSDMEVQDKYGNTPAYYASSDDAIWPLFASKFKLFLIHWLLLLLSKSRS